MQYNVNAKTRSLYIHWPFCPYKCHFCPFVALASHDQFMEQYHKALVTEIERFAAAGGNKASIETIHFGGGTPSTYPDNLLLDIFAILKRTFRIQKDAEIAIEVNPGTVRDEQLEFWKSLGINRLSIGVQSLKDSVLRKLNRLQTSDQVTSLLESAQYHYHNISVDLILGLPDVSEEEWKKLIYTAVLWPIKHISVYFLTVHENTPLYFKIKSNQVALPEDEQVVALYRWTCDKLGEHGFGQYELSNFARDGYISKHNSAYWDCKPYKGFGIGACSFDGRQRLQNEKNIMRYITAIEKEQAVEVFTEYLSEKQIRLEHLMLGLRRPCGVAWSTITHNLSENAKKSVKEAVDTLYCQGLIEWVDDHIRLTIRGLTVENEIITQLSHE